MPEPISHKVCSACNEDKPFSEYHRMPTAKYGLHPECKQCKSARNKKYRQTEEGQKTTKAYRIKFRSSPEGKEYRRREHDRYRKTENGKKALYAGMQRFRKRNPERIKAVQYINDRIRAGKIDRGFVCSKCGAVGVKIEAHHYKGYSREHWADIIWLCISCHKLEHRKLGAASILPLPNQEHAS